ncbi:MAG: hypothetical protein ACFKPT_32240 [Gloeotrichia echinulata GP01]
MKKKEESVHSSPTNIADFAMLNFARWSIRHSRAIHPTLIRVSVGLLSGKLKVTSIYPIGRILL